jgi:methionyl-tRNA formyltransferase
MSRASIRDNSYVVATIRPWHVDVFRRIISDYPGDWHLITKPDQLTQSRVRSLAPRYIFFPHWSESVPREILDLSECVCFHETDLPFGRGGSPIQNLVAQSIYDTKLSAFMMTNEMDAGPIYLQRPLSLLGLAEEIYVRAAHAVAKMILEIVEHEPSPTPQTGDAVVFKRRSPTESEVLADRLETLDDMFDHIRMLDAVEYPPAFVRHGNWLLELTRPARRTDYVEASVRIKLERDPDA